MKKLLFSIVIIIFSCQSKSKSDSDKIWESYMNNSNFKKSYDTLAYPYHGTSYKVVIDSNPTKGTVHKIFGYLANNPNTYGCYFKFNTKGNLDNYYFMAGDGKHDLYRVIYNSDKDKYEEQGNAYVDYLAPRKARRQQLS